MKTVTVRELRREFARKVEAPLRRGQTLVLRKGNVVLGRIVPEPRTAGRFPDFAARRKKIFGNRIIKLNVAEFLRKQRERRRSQPLDLS